MCRKDGEAGGPRRCGKHMAIRLASARATYQSLNHLLSEQQGVLESRSAWLDSLEPAAARKAQSQVRQASNAVRATLTRRSVAIHALKEAQEDYDSTREGLHAIREEYDKSPQDLGLRDRLLRAIDTYEGEASRREVTFGAQGPLSREDITASGPLGARLGHLGATGWLKSAPEPDLRTGLYEHRVNVVWHEGGRRRSLTIPLLSEESMDREQGTVKMRGEPTLSDIATHLQRQSSAVTSAGGSYAQWIENRGARNSLGERQRWRAATKAASAVKTISKT